MIELEDCGPAAGLVVEFSLGAIYIGATSADKCMEILDCIPSLATPSYFSSKTFYLIPLVLIHNH